MPATARTIGPDASWVAAAAAAIRARAWCAPVGLTGRVPQAVLDDRRSGHVARILPARFGIRGAIVMNPAFPDPP